MLNKDGLITSGQQITDTQKQGGEPSRTAPVYYRPKPAMSRTPMNDFEEENGSAWLTRITM